MRNAVEESWKEGLSITNIFLKSDSVKDPFTLQSSIFYFFFLVPPVYIHFRHDWN